MFGQACNYATTLNGTFKVKDVILMHSEGILVKEMKHALLALTDENLFIIVIITCDGTCRWETKVILHNMLHT